MRYILIGAMAVLLASCGGGRDRDRGPVVMRYASGPLNDACMASPRKQRGPAVCGCIQAVANTHLTNSEQRRAVGFFRDPHSAQEVRQSDRARDKDFWERYYDYGTQVDALCKGTL